MRPLIVCAGAPRDLGLDQGRAVRAALAADWRRLPRGRRLSLRLGFADARALEVARDVGRHFPRVAEGLEGLARGAGVPWAWLVTRLAADFPTLEPAAPLAATAACVGATPAGGVPAVAAELPDPWLLRRAEPEGGFRCLELATPWLPAALAAVSEAGIAGAVVSADPGADPGRCAAPAALLLQDALHRNGSLDSVLEWCLRRPAGGRATLLFADASGEAALVRCEGDARRIQRPADGLAARGSDPDGEPALEKALREAAPLAPESLAAALGRPALALDPVARRLCAVGVPGSERWLTLD